LKATDIYISTGLDPNQAVSGTLSYALGTGRPVISTAFANARELVSDDVGILVDFESPAAYTEAIIRLLEDGQLREQMGMNAYFKTRRMIWPNVAVQYAKVFSSHARSLARISEQKSLPKIKLDHLVHLTDSFGIAHSARLTRPDYRFGYTLDDNARALLAACTYYKKLGAASRSTTVASTKRTLLKLINIYLNFIQSSFQEDGTFANYIKKDRTPDREKNKKANLEDANGRTLMALAATATTRSLPKTARRQAHQMLSRRIEKGVRLESPRSIALWIKALYTLLDKKAEDIGIDTSEVLTEQCNRLVHLFGEASSPDWQWFESYLTYSNAVLSEALLLGYRATAIEDYQRVGKASLDFLIKQSFVDGVYMPIGEGGWYQSKGKRVQYDQQPGEAKSMVNALKCCYELTRDPKYHDLMRRAFFWFLGDNSLNQVVYDRHTGGCYDGVGKRSVNLNQGAEATISYLLARLAFEGSRVAP
ncbi:MAG: glycosyltransferase, partial [Dehalococcoidia bacterium]